MLRLYHGDKLIGLIKNAGPDDAFSMVGDIELTPEGVGYKEIFCFMTDEDKMMSGAESLPFDERYLDNWSIEDEHGDRKPILVPGIYEDGEICWRY